MLRELSIFYSFLSRLLPFWTSQKERRKTRFLTIDSCSSSKNLIRHNIHFIHRYHWVLTITDSIAWFLSSSSESSKERSHCLWENPSLLDLRSRVQIDKEPSNRSSSLECSKERSKPAFAWVLEQALLFLFFFKNSCFSSFFSVSWSRKVQWKTDFLTRQKQELWQRITELRHRSTEINLSCSKTSSSLSIKKVDTSSTRSAFLKLTTNVPDLFRPARNIRSRSPSRKPVGKNQSGTTHKRTNQTHPSAPKRTEEDVEQRTTPLKHTHTQKKKKKKKKKTPRFSKHLILPFNSFFYVGVRVLPSPPPFFERECCYENSRFSTLLVFFFETSILSESFRKERKKKNEIFSSNVR